jgi:hypothetical protein
MTDFRVMVLWVMVAIVGSAEQYAKGRLLEKAQEGGWRVLRMV